MLTVSANMICSQTCHTQVNLSIKEMTGRMSSLFLFSPIGFIGKRLLKILIFWYNSVLFKFIKDFMFI